MRNKLSRRQRREVCLVGGDFHPDLTEGIAKEMRIKVGQVALSWHANTEPYARFEESVRGKHVVIVQPHAPANGRSAQDALMQQHIMIDAARRASAKEITAVAPVLWGARQDRKAKGREPISVAVSVGMFEKAKVSRIVSVDLHSPQSQAIFDGPFDHLVAYPLLTTAMMKHIKGDKDQYLVISPDAGRTKMSSLYSDDLGIGIAPFIPKKRDPSDSSKIVRSGFVPEADGRTCIMFDDMIDTAGTVQTAAEILHDSGAKEIYLAATHGFFSGPATQRLYDSPIDKILVTNTLPIADEPREVLGDRLEIVSAAEMIGRALIEIITDGSVSQLFGGNNAV
jgi:ribose-phosphate pyrophosphokinase